MRARRDRSPRAAVALAGILLAGYGMLILLGLLAHESRIVGAALALGGAALVAAVAWRAPPAGPPGRPANASAARAWLVGGLGLLAGGGVLAYNVVTSSTFSTPEIGILGYGAALLAAAPYLGRRVGRADVGTLVAWSLPLLAGPLAMYAVDAAIDARVRVGASPLDWFITHLLVAPMAAMLDLVGFDATSTGQVVALETPGGKLSLTVGVVCAGLQPAILFLGVFALYAWQEQTPPRRLAALVALGLLGVYVANLVRLVLLALVGYRWGGVALQNTHEHAGWLLFVAWMLAYWWIVLRRLQGPPRAPTSSNPL